VRSPGQSLDEQRQDVVKDFMLWPMVFGATMILFAAWDWLRYYRPQAPMNHHGSEHVVRAAVFSGLPNF
jgi:hypothetical protein